MNNLQICATSCEELWKTDVNTRKPWLSGCHLHRVLRVVPANPDSTGSIVHKIILQALVLLTPGK